jgi:aspartyl-tRNA(Asn)/glutamyl-tRNA(Gln) amidotransferase subunit B
MGYIKEHKITLAECKVTPARLAHIVDLVEQGVINGPTAKEVFVFVAQTDKDPMSIIEEKGLKQIGSADELEAMVKEVIAANPKQTEEYRSGKDKLFGFFVGQMMQKTKGKGNPQLINDLIKKHLNQ